MNKIVAGEPGTGWQGCLRLAYDYREQKTQVIDQYHQAPLKVQRPFYPEGTEICHSVILHTAGGVVGGDRLLYDLHLHPNAHTLITTAAANKIYRSNGEKAQQKINIQIEKNACLEWLPQETIVFNGAIYQQDLRVELAPGATWLGWEMTRFGRTARGEQFLQGNWRSHTEVWQQGQPLWIDRQFLPASLEVIASPHGLAGQSVVASLAWVGVKVTPELINQARSLWHSGADPTTQVGVTRLMQGLLCRYRGQSTSEVRNWFMEIWQLLRQSCFNRPSCPPRVWPL